MLDPIIKFQTGEEPEVIEVKVWNETVANLTLMALGSSAPEILLSIIEIAGNNFKAGELGPGTIVGECSISTRTYVLKRPISACPEA